MFFKTIEIEKCKPKLRAYLEEQPRHKMVGIVSLDKLSRLIKSLSSK